MMESSPVEFWKTPLPVPAPAVAFPVMFIVPVELLFAPCADVPAPAVELPVMFTVPAELFKTACALVNEPPTQFPVMLNVPVPRFAAARLLLLVPAVKFPTTDAVAGRFAENSKQFVESVPLCVTFAVSVMPSLRTNFPVPALLISSQVALAVMVTVWPVEARASSPVVGTTPPVHVAPALKLPLAADTMSAMVRVLSR
jgi:hypothetical protein